MNVLNLLSPPAARVPRPLQPGAQILDLPDPDQVTIALEYPGKIMFRPTVHEGDRVACNQIIGRSDLGNCLHASVSGTVKEIEPIWSATGDHVPAVVISSNDEPALDPQRTLAQEGLDLQTAGRIELMKACGAVSPWTTPGREDSESDLDQYPAIRHLVIVGVNQEPTTVNYELLLKENPDAVREGMYRLREIAPNVGPRLLVAAAQQAWATTEFGAEAAIVPLAPQYRRRIRRVVIPRLIGLKVPAADAFRAHGIAVVTVEQLLALSAALHGRPFVHKTMSVAGHGMTEPVTVRVPLGASVRWILQRLGLTLPEGGRVVMGGPMRGMAHFSADTPVSKFENGILLLDRASLPSEVNLTCINCGLCTRACSARLQVHLLGRCVEFGDFGGARRHHPEACLGCGLCAFVCPAHRPLVQLVKMAQKYGG